MSSLKVISLVVVACSALVALSVIIFGPDDMTQKVALIVFFMTNLIWGWLIRYFSSKHDGALQFSKKEDGTDIYHLVVNGDPETWPDKNEIVLKVEKISK